MQITDLQWDDENTSHIADHSVSPEEVEQVCYGSHLSHREPGERFVIGGQSEAGRYLIVVVERLHWNLFRAVTAYEMNDQHKRAYRRRMKPK